MASIPTSPATGPTIVYDQWFIGQVATNTSPEPIVIYTTSHGNYVFVLECNECHTARGSNYLLVDGKMRCSICGGKVTYEVR